MDGETHGLIATVGAGIVTVAIFWKRICMVARVARVWLKGELAREERRVKDRRSELVATNDEWRKLFDEVKSEVEKLRVQMIALQLRHSAELSEANERHSKCEREHAVLKGEHATLKSRFDHLERNLRKGGADEPPGQSLDR